MRLAQCWAKTTHRQLTRASPPSSRQKVETVRREDPVMGTGAALIATVRVMVIDQGADQMAGARVIVVPKVGVAPMVVGRMDLRPVVLVAAVPAGHSAKVDLADRVGEDREALSSGSTNSTGSSTRFCGKSSR